MYIDTTIPQTGASAFGIEDKKGGFKSIVHRSNKTMQPTFGYLSEGCVSTTDR